jgi:polyisoprenyl-phosphate glycosyltransferase
MKNSKIKKELISIIVPVCNEEGTLKELQQRVNLITKPLVDYDFELIFIDNGSTDDSPTLCRDICAQEPAWKYIQFSRDFGIEASFFAGATFAKGAALIYLFSDLQDPPEAIPQIIEKWKQGNDVVYGILKKREDETITKSIGAFIAYRLIYFLCDIKIPINATDYRLLSRPVIDAMVSCKERNRYMRGVTHWIGYKQASFEFERTPRKYGESNHGVLWCIKYAIQVIFSFSVKPIRLSGIVGVFTMLLSVVGSIAYTILTILTRTGIWDIPAPPTGITTIVLLIFFFGGINCLFLGILGEYITQIHAEVKFRPIWVLKNSIGFSEDELKEKNSL